MSVFNSIANFFKPSAEGVRVRDVVREVPGATKEIGKTIFSDVARFTFSGLTGLGQGALYLSGDKTAVTPPQPLNIPGFEPIKSYQQTFAERQARGESIFKNVAKTAGSVAIDEPVGFAFKPLFLAGGILGKSFKSGALDPLIQQARQIASKGGTLDEFLKTSTKYFHGGDVIKEVKLGKSNYAKTFFMSDSADYAKEYASKSKSGVVNDIYVDPNAKLIDIKNATPEEITAIKNKIQEIKDTHVPYSGKGGFNPTFGGSTDELVEGAMRGKSHFAEDPALVDVYKKLGYDGMVSYEDMGLRGKNIGIWNKGMVKTKSELEDIWKQANSSLAPDSLARTPQAGGTLRTPAQRTLQGGIGKSVALADDTIGSLGSQVDPVTKITEALTKAESLLPKQKELYAAERAKRAAKIRSVGEKVPGEAGFKAQLGQLKGELPKVEFESVRKAVTQSDVDELFNMVRKNEVLSDYEKISAQRALTKIVGAEGGKLPTTSEIELLRQVFPKPFIDALMMNRSLMEKLWSGVGEVLNLPRAIMATADLSAPLRQGVFLIGRPKQWIPAFGNMFKYAFSEKAYQGMLKDIKSRPTYPLMRESKLAITEIGSKDLTQREEMFMSNLAEKIPIFGPIARGSNRAYSGFLSKIRADVFDDLLVKGRSVGIKDERVIDDLSKYINAATGRGSIGKLEKASVALNSIFFSPKLMFSRLNLLNPNFYYKLDPFVRKQALQDLFTFTSVASSVAGLAYLGGAEVEVDPRSSDFLKIKLGNTRYDPYGGFQQYIRLASQLVTGKIISSTTGREIVLGEGYKPLTRKDIFMRFLESKEAPILSFATAMMQGQTSIGEEVNVPTEIIERSIPLVVQDMYDIYKERGIESLGMVVPGVFGVGSQTYGTQELVFGKSKLGVETAQIKPVTDLAQDINAALFGDPELKTTSASYNVEAFYDQMLKMPREEAAKKFNEISQVNPNLAKKILEVVEDRQMGITVKDKELKAKGVSSGDRATAIAENLSELETDQEKARLWEEYVTKKIITPEVARQVQIIINQNP